MYNFRPNLHIGFHGCDESVRNALVAIPIQVKISKKPYDWLGNGFYVWENNYVRAKHWAEDKFKRGRISKASVVGVIYTLADCLDFSDSLYIDSIEQYYYLMKRDFEEMGITMPINEQIVSDLYQDKLIRKLDCSVIEYYQLKIEIELQYQRNRIGFSHYEGFDTVRGIFTEGGPAFPGAGIQKKNHIQVCIRNLDMIKGFFIPKV
jgi:hypothetical protein